MQYLHLLVLEDDPLVVEGIRHAIPSHWTLISNPALEDLSYKKIDAAFVDIHLSGDPSKTEGLGAIEKIKDLLPHTEIVAMSGNIDRKVMENSLRAGASRFLAKPLSFDEVNLTLDKIEAFLSLKNTSFSTQKKPWIGDSLPSKKILRWIAQIKGEHGPFLIEGETGTGKEIVAQLISQQEGLQRPFIKVNVAAIPDNLFESEFFGYNKGAFSGAQQNKIGFAEAANNGDLFLDEIETLTPPMQAKLLRFIEYGELIRLGSNKPIKVNTRVIAASNEDLQQKVHSKSFREDLYWRLNQHKIHLPPLRKRKEDLYALCEYFLQSDKRRHKTFDPSAWAAMMNHEWPGNVRELKRVCEQLLIVAPLPIIRGEDVLRLTSTSFTGQEEPPPLNDFSPGFDQLVQKYEAQILLNALNWFKSAEEVTKNLKISKSKLYRKIKEYHLNWGDIDD